MSNGCLETTRRTVPVLSNPRPRQLGYGRELPQAIAALRMGATVLDLGSGDGAYSFLAATAVGESGRIIGVETAPEMIAQARANVIHNGFYHVSFRLGELEHLPVADRIADAVISHYGINPSYCKTQVFREAFRVLKPGGHLAIVDTVATKILPEDVEENDVLYTECLSGVLMLDDIEDMLRAAGFDRVQSQIKQNRNGFRPASATSRALKPIVAPALIEAVKPA
ncbi:methyltransferase domain-containing protein [Candidatus Entotheonella palauensis]|uniref:methyltransferase domain-containing protein n=1 Tax=Candidatus Entotheonella palauensis TaxID=93172 RepID=UPI000B7CAC53|nr:methyltransferase domain-containing protein [Candidatus Entotheonella palauensis]